MIYFLLPMVLWKQNLYSKYFQEEEFNVLQKKSSQEGSEGIAAVGVLPPVLPAEDQRKWELRNRKRSGEGGGIEEEHWFVGPFLKSLFFKEK